MTSEQTKAAKIVVTPNGPYLVYGNPNFVHNKQINSEHGEPMTWQTNQHIETGNRPVVALCRCGGSANKP
ncbi:MAG: CDGSH iron-sulfur domain-containing protein, partial [Chloroflexi bacterium]|nr:CDGSH iron-sulfur domain-containing protein [Chloroflexota bacterium]